MIKTIFIAGPTATGKTDVAIEICKRFKAIGKKCDIINADSRQVYKGMDIGTNKGNIIENQDDIELSNCEILKGFDVEYSGITGYLFNEYSPSDSFNLAKFQKTCLELISILDKKNIIPIVVGGTGLYIDSLVKGYTLVQDEPDFALRESLEGLPSEVLFEKLLAVSPDLANRLNESDKYNPQRLIRAIEKASSTIKNYKTGSVDRYSKPENKKVLESLIIYPKFNRDELFEKINSRVEKMFDIGLIDEVKSLLEAGFADSIPMNGIGYKEVAQYINSQISLDECKDKIKQGHRNYAKRQITWFEGSGRGYNLIKFDFQKEIDKICDSIVNFSQF